MADIVRSIAGAFSVIAMCALLALGIWVTKSWGPIFGLLFVALFSAQFPWRERKEFEKKATGKL